MQSPIGAKAPGSTDRQEDSMPGVVEWSCFSGEEFLALRFDRRLHCYYMDSEAKNYKSWQEFRRGMKSAWSFFLLKWQIAVSCITHVSIQKCKLYFEKQFCSKCFATDEKIMRKKLQKIHFKLVTNLIYN